MKHFSLLVCLSVCLLADSEAALEAEGIIGGDIAPPNEYNYQISLQRSGRHLCGGAIIGERHILTAAHCVTEKRNRDFTTYPKQVVAGAFDLNNKGSDTVTVDVEKIYIPKKYGPDSDEDDIAIIKLKKPLGLDDNDQLSKLELPEAKKSYAGKEATITGYGWTWIVISKDPVTGWNKETGGANTREKKFAVAKVLSNAACQESFFDRISYKQLCARVIQRDPDAAEGVCAGDSGGPLVYNDSVVIGVLSTSPVGCDESKERPAMYTRVSKYLAFIESAIADNVTSGMRVHEQ